MHQIPDRSQHRQHLSGNGRNRSPSHAHMESVDQGRIQNDIGNAAKQRCKHCKARIAICTDDRIHCLTKHIERNPDVDPEEILLGKRKRLFIDDSAEQRQKSIRKAEIDNHQHDADRRGKNHGIADILSRFLALFAAQSHGNHGAAAVAYHDGQRQGNDRQREYDRIRCIAIRTEFRRICNKDLIDDVIQCTDQQRHHAWNCILAHQFSKWLRFQKSILIFHKKNLQEFSAKGDFCQSVSERKTYYRT